MMDPDDLYNTRAYRYDSEDPNHILYLFRQTRGRMKCLSYVCEGAAELVDILLW